MSLYSLIFSCSKDEGITVSENKLRLFLAWTGCTFCECQIHWMIVNVMRFQAYEFENRVIPTPCHL